MWALKGYVAKRMWLGYLGRRAGRATCAHAVGRRWHAREAPLAGNPDVEPEQEQRPEQYRRRSRQDASSRPERIEVVVDRGHDDAHDYPEDRQKTDAVPEHSQCDCPARSRKKPLGRRPPHREPLLHDEV